MLKCTRKVADRDDQNSVFAFARSREQPNLSDAIRNDGRTPLAGVPDEDGSGTGEEWDLNGSVVRSAGANNRRNGRSDEEMQAERKLSPRTIPAAEDNSRDIHSDVAGTESRNTKRYCIHHVLVDRKSVV